jgi:hypothetical protein
MELGDELHAGYVSLKRFHDLFSQRLPFLAPGSHQIECGICIESLGGYHTGPDRILFYMEGIHFIFFSGKYYLTQASR